MKSAEIKALARCALIVALAGLAPGAAFSEEAPCTGNALEVGACQDRALRAIEQRITAVYTGVGRMLDAGEVDSDISYFPYKKAQLAAAQGAWVKYRDAQCGAEGAMVIPGSGVATVTGTCLLTLNRERLRYLEGLAEVLRGQSKLCVRKASACDFK